MGDGSIARRTLIVTAALLGASALWVGMVSLAGVLAVGLVSGDSDKAPKPTSVSGDVAPHAKLPPKPNG